MNTFGKDVHCNGENTSTLISDHPFSYFISVFVGKGLEMGRSTVQGLKLKRMALILNRDRSQVAGPIVHVTYNSDCSMTLSN